MPHFASIGHCVEKALRVALICAIKLYRFLLSPWVGQHCRFTPTCSAYSIEAIEQYGVIKGSAKMIKRLSRCHPWCEGGYDPLPPRKTGTYN